MRNNGTYIDTGTQIPINVRINAEYNTQKHSNTKATDPIDINENAFK